LNQGYGWAANVNLVFIFDRIFSVEKGGGYPAHRKVQQHEARTTLGVVSQLTHRSLAEIIRTLPEEVVMPAIAYPGIPDLIDFGSIEEAELKRAFEERYRLL
jgi:hypothetical protein